MATVGKPDLANYRTRFAQILPVIPITLPAGVTTAMVNVFKAPGIGQASYPFWVIGRPAITLPPQPEAARIERWRIEWTLFLARDDDDSTDKVEALADVIDRDVSDVMTYFGERWALVSSALTANQAGYIPGSLKRAVNPDSYYPVKTGVFIGSGYTFSIVHRIVYDPQYR